MNAMDGIIEGLEGSGKPLLQRKPKRSTVLPPMPLQKPILPLKPGAKPIKRLAKPVAAKRGRP